jgi:hypothetical protein
MRRRRERKEKKREKEEKEGKRETGKGLGREIGRNS